MWAAEITYLPIARRFLYLVTRMDWHSRYVPAWRLSDTLEADFFGPGQARGVQQGPGQPVHQPRVHPVLEDIGVRISRDGKGRYADNILVERLWRTLRYERVHLKAYGNATEARRELGEYFRFCNNRRSHQAQGYWTSAEVFYGEQVVKELKESRCSDQPVSVLYEGVQESHLIVAYSCPTNGVHLTFSRNHGFFLRLAALGVW